MGERRLTAEVMGPNPILFFLCRREKFSVLYGRLERFYWWNDYDRYDDYADDELLLGRGYISCWYGYILWAKVFDKK